MKSVSWNLHREPKLADPYRVTEGAVSEDIYRLVATNFRPAIFEVLDSVQGALEGIIEDPVVSLDANRRRQH
jgi:hypothetical protein